MMHARGRTHEQGFSLIELLIVLAVMAILGAITITSMGAGKAKQRVDATSGAARNVEGALAFYVLDYPRTGTADPLLQRGGTAPWKGNDGIDTAGLYSPTGDPYLKVWPKNAYADRPIHIYRAASCPATGSVGDVYVCRVPAQGPQSYRVVAFGKNRSGDTIVAYDNTVLR